MQTKKRAGKSAITQAGERVREEIEQGAQSAKKAIAKLSRKGKALKKEASPAARKRSSASRRQTSRKAAKTRYQQANP
jgi:hypothetical protein